ncbi:MAG: AAA family ATPase [Phycisphaerae bacterium]
MIKRDVSTTLRQAAREFPVVALTGPRQSGKSTLCRALFPDHAYASLESPDTRRFVADDPLYGGVSRQQRSSATVLPWNDLDGHEWT